ncbi:MAG: hypothetical protein F4Z67_06605 [Synechococcus sp. SB0667_bin_8]|nr:hypothetical protein [Synechococcus sp. SB0667_bin_8]MYG65023.1 hypothetical protein [Synechococcus sp. SB0675_bin_7]MYK86425.1 hypothetical protein [Synechococcus sp. SB0669_bin_7]
MHPDDLEPQQVVLKKEETTVTHSVRAVNDNTDEPDTVAGLKLFKGAGYALDPPGNSITVTVNVTDNDDPFPASVIITESGSDTTVAEYTDGTQLTDSYEVRLATQPTHDVTVTAPAAVAYT